MELRAPRNSACAAVEPMVMIAVAVPPEVSVTLGTFMAQDAGRLPPLPGVLETGWLPPVPGPLQARAIVPANPPTEVSVMVSVLPLVAPAAKVSAGAEEAMVNPGPMTVIGSSGADAGL